MNGVIDKNNAAKDVLACAAYIAERLVKRDEQAECLTKTARIYARRNDVDTAAQLADAIGDPHSRDAMLTEVVGKCAAEGDDEYAWQLVEAIENKGFQNEAKQRIAVAQAARGAFATADETAQNVDGFDFVYGDITIRMAKAQVENVEKRLAKIPSAITRAQVFYEIAVNKIRQKNIDKGLENLQRAADEASQADFPEERVQMFLNIAHQAELIGAGDFAKPFLLKARETAEQLEPNFREQLLTQTALGFAANGDFATAENIAHSITDLHQKSVVYGLLAIEQKAFGRDEEALEWLEESFQILQSQKPHQVRSTPARTAWHADIAKNFARCGDFERALEVVALITDDDSRDTACGQIAVEAVRHGKENFAQQAVYAIGSVETEIYALIGRANAERDVNEREKALETLHEAEGLIDDVKTLGGRLNVLAALANAFIEFDKREVAAELWHESLQMLEPVTDNRVKSSTLADLAQTQAAIGIELTDEDCNLLNYIVRKS